MASEADNQAPGDGRASSTPGTGPPVGGSAWGRRLFRWLLHRRLPLVGGLLQGWAIRSLGRDGSRAALNTLVEVFVRTADVRVREQIHSTLLQLDSPMSSEVIAFFWAATRQPELETLLIQKNTLPNTPPEIRLLVALKLGKVESLAGGTTEELVTAATFSTLLQACQDRDPDIANAARSNLHRLGDPEAIQLLGEQWRLTRDPLLEQALIDGQLVAPRYPARLYTALKVNHLQDVGDFPASMVPALLNALQDQDPEIALNGCTLVTTLPWEIRSDLADPLCGQWAKTRHPALERVMLASELVAGNPLEVHVLSALKTGRVEALLTQDGGAVPALLTACADNDQDIATRARSVLRQLEHPAAQEAVCQAFLQEESTLAGDAAVDAGYLPEEDPDRALFLFLTQQWDRYETIDFDHRLLQAIFVGGRFGDASADNKLRQRILEKLRLAGRPAFLTVLTGGKSRTRLGQLSRPEADVLVQMLEKHRDWPGLWKLVFELSLRTSARIVRILVRNEWQPEKLDERTAFEQLAIHVRNLELHDASQHLIPPAVLCARARVPGRVNDVAFSPVRPLIAVGTGMRKVVLWNFQTATSECVLRGFDHSIGKVIFTPDDTLLCSERTNQTKEEYTLHGLRGEERFRIGHRGLIKSMAPVQGGEAVLAFRNHHVVQLDTQGDRQLQGHSFPFWCRSVRAGGEGQRVALLHEGVTLVGWPALDVLASTPRANQRGVPSCATFTNARDILVVGKHNGEVLACRQDGNTLLWGDVIATHEKALQAVEMLGCGTVLLAASSDGLLTFVRWPECSSIGTIQVEGQRLTSLHVSPEGAFMVLGDSDASLSLWDLRALEIPTLLEAPFARAVPAQLAAVNALLDTASLPITVNAALQFAQTVLRHRFRYDVQVDELPTIRAGAFDIAVE